MAKEPEKTQAKHHLWRLGAYLTPFIYAAVLLLWPHVLPAALVIAAGVFVAGLFAAAGILHFRDWGGFNRLERVVQNNVWKSAGIIIVACLVVLGGLSYWIISTYVMRYAQASHLSAPQNGSPSKDLGGKENAKSSPPSSGHSVESPSTPPQRVGAGRKENKASSLPAPPSVAIGGDVDMSGDGCQQKIIAGSNNTNICVPRQREIKPENQKILLSALEGKPFPGFLVGCVQQSQESCIFAKSLMDVFDKTSPQWIKSSGFSMDGDPITFKGVAILISRADQNSPPEQAVRLADALRRAGIDAKLSYTLVDPSDPKYDRIAPGGFELFIGNHP